MHWEVIQLATSGLTELVMKKDVSFSVNVETELGFKRQRVKEYPATSIVSILDGPLLTLLRFKCQANKGIRGA